MPKSTKDKAAPEKTLQSLMAPALESLQELVDAVADLPDILEDGTSIAQIKAQVRMSAVGASGAPQAGLMNSLRILGKLLS